MTEQVEKQAKRSLRDSTDRGIGIGHFGTLCLDLDACGKTGLHDGFSSGNLVSRCASASATKAAGICGCKRKHFTLPWRASLNAAGIAGGKVAIALRCALLAKVPPKSVACNVSDQQRPRPNLRRHQHQVALGRATEGPVGEYAHMTGRSVQTIDTSRQTTANTRRDERHRHAWVASSRLRSVSLLVSLSSKTRSAPSTPSETPPLQVEAPGHTRDEQTSGVRGVKCALSHRAELGSRSQCSRELR